MNLDIFADVYDYLVNFTLGRALRVFWLFFLFDFPRYIVVDVVLVFFEMYRRMRPAKKNERFEFELQKRPPLVSVIVPVLNEQRTIEWTIRSLMEQTYRNLEIIVVDDGSTDRTEEICRRQHGNGGIHYYRLNRRAGKSAALNYGLRFAKGSYIVFVDSDTTFDRDAVINLVREFADPKVGAVVGNLAARNRRRNLLTRLQDIEYLFSISIGRIARDRLRILPVVSGAFGAFRKELIDHRALGGHEPGPGNDSDLTIRIRKLGRRIAFAPRARCLTNVPESFPALIRQRLRWDRNLVKNRLRKHRDVFDPRSKNFRLIDVLCFVDTVFFHMVLAVMTIIYIVDLAINFPQMVPFLLLINFVLYFSAEAIELAAGAYLLREPRYLRQILYLPLFNPYKILLKYFRVIGYAQELFFRVSLKDHFAPLKVRERMIRW